MARIFIIGCSIAAVIISSFSSTTNFTKSYGSLTQLLKYKKLFHCQSVFLKQLLLLYIVLLYKDYRYLHQQYRYIFVQVLYAWACHWWAFIQKSGWLQCLPYFIDINFRNTINTNLMTVTRYDDSCSMIDRSPTNPFNWVSNLLSFIYTFFLYTIGWIYMHVDTYTGSVLWGPHTVVQWRYLSSRCTDRIYAPLITVTYMI